VEKVQRTPREVIFYLRALEPRRPITLEVPLVPRIPSRAQLPAPTVYEYYKPERKAVGPRPTLEVTG
jgi:hypothetical protein